MKGFFIHSTKILKWRGGNYLQRKVFTIFLFRQEEMYSQEDIIALYSLKIKYT
jgi:hypothetical protein